MTDARDDIREAAVALRKHPAMLSVCLAAATSSKDLREALGIFEDAIEAALRAERARGMGEAGEWRPIESAPRDGTPILYINRFDEIGHCRWSEAIDADYSSCWWDDERDDEVVPLWWMRPLPAPPAIRAKQKETEG